MLLLKEKILPFLCAVLAAMLRLLRRVWLAIGGIVLLICVAVIIGGIYFDFLGEVHAAKSESKRYAKGVIPELVASFRLPDEFTELLRSSDGTRPKKGEVEWLLSLYSSLGGLVRLEMDQAGDGTLAFTLSEEGSILTDVRYIIPARFELGPAVILISVQKYHGAWLVADFSVEAPSFYDLGADSGRIGATDLLN